MECFSWRLEEASHRAKVGRIELVQPVDGNLGRSTIVGCQSD